ncbi:hypothetical protein Hanom_Chr11g00970871 [Helianthus anomalus]
MKKLVTKSRSFSFSFIFIVKLPIVRRNRDRFNESVFALETDDVRPAVEMTVLARFRPLPPWDKTRIFGEWWQQMVLYGEKIRVSVSRWM